MFHSQRALLTVIVFMSIGLWLCTVGLLYWSVTAANNLILLAEIITAVMVTSYLFREGQFEAFLSPLYALGMLVIAFYGVGPAVYLYFFPDPPATFSIAGHIKTADYVGGIGETYILQFAAMCFAFLALVLKFRRSARPVSAVKMVNPPMYFASAIALILIVGIACLLVAGRWHPTLEAFLSGGIGREVNHALAPLMSLGCITMVYFAAQRKLAYRMFTALILLAALIAMVTSTSMAKLGVYIIVAALVLYAVASGMTAKRLAVTATAMFAVLTGAITLTLAVRDHGWADEGSPSARDKVFSLIAAKIIYRQGVSGDCLDRVVRLYQHAENSPPYYFLTAVIPRSLWPEKPNLSRGPEFGEHYCGQKGAIRSGHSESITLIGEPLLHAGTAGLFVAQAFMGVLLSVITISGTSGRPLSLVVMTALLPWTATFEPNFAQYFGTMVKVFLTLSPLIIGLAWCLRFRPRGHSIRA